MVKKSIILVICVVAFMLSGCAMTMQPVTGVIFNEAKGPLLATSNTGSSKVGVAIAKSYVGVVGTGDASIETAMKNGGITKIHHVDYQTKNYLGVYAELTVTVYGE